MKKRGFTLVELLAIISIIAIIALISIPIVVNIIDNGKKNSFLDSVKGIVRVIELDNSKNDYVAGSYEINDGVIKNKTTNETLKSEGGKGESGTITISDRGVITYAIHNDRWCALFKSNKQTVIEYNGTCTN